MLFPEWETFYVIVGSSAGALTGLMFVVIALVADFGGSERQTVLLLFIGIHNAWDTVTYVIVARWEGRRGPSASPPAATPSEKTNP